MFTGIVSAVGRVAKVTQNGGGLQLSIRVPYKGLRRGESIAVNGGFTAHAVETTLDRTLLREWVVGRPVNLERAVRAIDRLGGHLVQGHVDGVAGVTRVTKQGDAVLVDLQVPAEVLEVSILHGSLTVDGVSLTVNALPGGDTAQVSLVPFTRAHTTLGALRPGDRVHVEGDVLGKYVRRLCRSET